MNQIKNLSLFGICFAFVVIALGAWTRLVDAGLGCPDWPGCYGFVVFPINETDIAIAESRYPLFPYDINKAIPEVVHRYCLLYTSPSPRDRQKSRMPSSA